MAPAKTPLGDGIYVPIITPFLPGPGQEVDHETLAFHAKRLADAGVAAVVALGSNGEAVHLDRDERRAVVATCRRALDTSGHAHVPLIAGCSAQSVRESVQNCADAAAAGAGYALNLAPSYYRNAVDDDMIYAYFTAVADASPIPVLLYNYPGVVAGVDMSTDLIIRIAEHDNIAGVKFTCGNTGKLLRVAQETEALGPGEKAAAGRFVATGGLADMMVATAAVGGSGVVAGTANVVPRVCVRLWQLAVAAKGGAAAAAAALELQQTVARADAALAKNTVPNTKSALAHFYGYGGIPRAPLAAASGSAAAALVAAMQAAHDLEGELEAAAARSESD